MGLHSWDKAGPNSGSFRTSFYEAIPPPPLFSTSFRSLFNGSSTVRDDEPVTILLESKNK
jgi:hypothetical protein